MSDKTSAPTDDAGKMIKLFSSDEKSFLVARNVIAQSITINTAIETLGMDERDTDEAIPLPNIDANTLERVIVFLEKRFEEPVAFGPPNQRTNLSVWDKQYLDVDRTSLFQLMLAANYLDIIGLLDITTQHVANMVEGKTTEQMRVILGLTNDFTPEEEEQVKRENAWCEPPL